MVIGVGPQAARLHVARKRFLLFSAHQVHTTLMELCPTPKDQTTQWSVCLHDSLYAKINLDTELSQGLNTYLTEHGGKTGNFQHLKQLQVIKQQDSIVCFFMALCRLILKLTGGELAEAHWSSSSAPSLTCGCSCSRRTVALSQRVS
jgi:hypothetical protein